MARRPVFVPIDDSSDTQLVREKSVEFKWHPGLALSQKRKNIIELHKAAEKLNLHPLLEVSSKSDRFLGMRLSAFSLSVETEKFGFIPLESAFQGSKVFSGGGPYIDLYGQQGPVIKKDERLVTSGKLVSFSFEGQEWEIEPKTAFYDWLYITAAHRDQELREGLLEFTGFTDIEFNPKRSINCQARSCALYVSLYRRDLLDKVLSNRDLFLKIMKQDSYHQPHSLDKRQQKLL